MTPKGNCLPLREITSTELSPVYPVAQNVNRFTATIEIDLSRPPLLERGRAEGPGHRIPKNSVTVVFLEDSDPTGVTLHDLGGRFSLCGQDNRGLESYGMPLNGVTRV